MNEQRPNRDQAEGKAKQVEGEIKDRAGGALGDNSTQAEGKLDKAKGKVQEAWGDAKDKLSDDRR